MKVSKSRDHFSFYSNQSGFAMLSIVLICSVIAATGFISFNLASDNHLSVSRTTRDHDMALLNKKASIISGYMVVNSLVLCRAKGFNAGVNSCIWGGHLHKDKMFPKNFGMEKDKKLSKDRKTLVMNIVSSDIPKGWKQTVSYRLKNFKEAGGLEFVLDIPADLKDVDQDYYIVHFRVELVHEESKRKIFNDYGIRRPLANIELDAFVNTPCLMSCVSGVSEHPAPGCRGPQVSPKVNRSELFLNAKNLGPGPLYQLSINKTTTYNQDFFKLPPKLEESDFFENLEVLMPGDEASRSEKLECLPPRYVVSTRRIGRRGQRTVAINVHSDPLSKTEFEFDIAKENRDLAAVGADLPIEPLKINTKFGKDFVNIRKTTTRTYYVPSH